MRRSVLNGINAPAAGKVNPCTASYKICIECKECYNIYSFLGLFTISGRQMKTCRNEQTGRERESRQTKHTLLYCYKTYY